MRNITGATLGRLIYTWALTRLKIEKMVRESAWDEEMETYQQYTRFLSKLEMIEEEINRRSNG